MPISLLQQRFPPRHRLPGAETVKVDIQPQPYLALQDALCAMVALALARHTEGLFIVNIDDTDPDPLENSDTATIFNQLGWLDLHADEIDHVGSYGPYLWSARRDIYRDVAMQLVEKDLAYHCFYQHGEMHPCEDDEVSHLIAGENVMVCLRVPAGREITYTDPVYGHYTYGTGLIGDIPLLAANSLPMPYFAHVVDNYWMRVTTHVRRHSALADVPREALIYEALEWEMPALLHLPAVRDPLAHPLFDEAHFHANLTEHYTPEAVLNYLTQLIWTHPEGKVIYPFTDFITHFGLNPVLSAAVSINYETFNSIQERYTYA